MISTRGEVKLIDFGVAKASTKLEQTIGHIPERKVFLHVARAN